jgi:hypothetical protein
MFFSDKICAHRTKKRRGRMLRKSEEQGEPSLMEEQREPSFVGPIFGTIHGDSN